jgi:hypothetical protein
MLAAEQPLISQAVPYAMCCFRHKQCPTPLPLSYSGQNADKGQSSSLWLLSGFLHFVLLVSY